MTRLEAIEAKMAALKAEASALKAAVKAQVKDLTWKLIATTYVVALFEDGGIDTSLVARVYTRDKKVVKKGESTKTACITFRNSQGELVVKKQCSVKKARAFLAGEAIPFKFGSQLTYVQIK